MPVLEADVDVRVDEEKKTQKPWKVVLYNDNTHTFDEVILQVQRATGCSLEQASWIVMEVDARGRGICYEGTRETCDKVAGILRQIRLQVEIDLV